MANIVKLKRSSVVGKVPDAGNIEVGEPAVNLVDRILYTKDTGGNVIVIGSGTTSNVIEGSNLYFTNARAIGAFSEGSGIVIDSNGLISANITLTSSVTSVNGQTGTVVLSTANIAENGNLYYTAARVYSNVISIGYATNANVALKANITDLTTANVTEVTNLYFTSARSRQALTAGTGVAYDNSTGTISISQNVDTHSSVTFGNVTITGNLTVQGNAVIFESNTLVINDPLIQVGRNPVGDSVDLGFFGHYIGGTPSIERHAGLFRDASDGQFKLFANLDPEPVNVVDTSNTSYQSANLVVNFIVGKVTDISNHTTTNLSEGTNLYFTNPRSYANTLVAIKTGNGIIYNNTTGNITLSTTGVTASTYGGAAVQPVIVVDAFGRITSVSNVTSTVANTNITGNIISSQITSVANSQITGNIISSKLEPTAVTAGVYGNATIIPVITVDQQGRITNASNVTSTVANTQISGNIISSQITSVANSQITGNIISSKLEPTAVTASTYGGAAVQPVIVIDQQGRITSASNVTSTVANTNITGNIISSQITSVANSQITGNIISSKLEPTAVTASTYGGAAVQTIITVDQQGRITSASNVTSTVANTNITGNIISSQITSIANSQITGNTISSKLEPTGVTASTYGGAAVQPVIVIDQQGRITSASNVTSTVANTNITGNIISSQITSVANTQISGNIISSQITSVANTQISGNIISSQITSVANSQITGNTISSKLEPTGVTAGVYGNATIIPVITVDQQGRITNVSNASVTGVSSGTSNAVSNTQIIAANGTSTNYNLADYPSTSNTLIFVDGLLQYSPVHYSFSSNTISFVTAPSNGEQIYIVTLSPGTGGGGSSTSTVDPTSIKRINYGLNILLGR